MRPATDAGRATLHAAGGDEETYQAGVAYLRSLTDDPGFAEAVSVSSPALAHRLSVLREGGATSPPALRRAVQAASRYWLRRCGRATPYGLLAGVTTARFDDAAAVRMGERHRRHVRPDMGWLLEIVHRSESDPVVLRRLRLVANDLCRSRADRWVVPYVPDRRRSGPAAMEKVVEVTVRNTAAVQAVTELAGRPIGFTDLVDGVRERFPAAAENDVTGLLVELVSYEMLLTDLPPLPDSTDPLGHVAAYLTGTPTGDELDRVRASLEAYRDAPPGDGTRQLTAVTTRMRELYDADHLVQVDLGLDADVCLPRTVAAEAAAAADVLWRCSPSSTRPPHLREYHAEFLERYGAELVPVARLLDPDAGLGAPAGYVVPPSERAEPPPAAPSSERDGVLATVVQETLLAGGDEIELDDDLLDLLGGDEGVPPASFELSVEVHAESAAALDAGDFLLVVSPLFGSAQAGATAGRFAHVLPEGDRAELRALVRGSFPTDEVPAQLSFRSPGRRGDNVGQVPQWLDHRIPVATYADRGAPGTLGVDDLLVGADAERLFLVSASLGRRILPSTLHKAHTGLTAPNIAHFLTEVALDGVRQPRAWDWGGLTALPYLPRVRHGRTILSTACWRPDLAGPRHAELSARDWDVELAAWRERFRVPRLVLLCEADHRIPLDLDEPLHRRLLRHELGRTSRALLRDFPADDATSGPGWLGGHANELVVPFLSAEEVPREPAQTPDTTAIAAVRERPAGHLPGGEWLHACLYCAADRQPEILADRLPALLEVMGEAADRWFFIRYRDPEPHVRLRFHGDPGELARALPGLHAWAAALRAEGLCRRLVLAGYDPELERYGGPEAIVAAERVFGADSETVCAELRMVRASVADGRGDLPVDLAAANALLLARAFLGGPDAAVDWVAGAYPKGDRHREFADRRREAMRVVDPYLDTTSQESLAGYRGLAGLVGAEAVLDAWQRRHAAVVTYREALDSLGDRSWSRPTTVLRSLVHMHVNRACGVDAHTEAAVHAVARGAGVAHRDRRRHFGEG